MSRLEPTDLRHLAATQPEAASLQGHGRPAHLHAEVKPAAREQAAIAPGDVAVFTIGPPARRAASSASNTQQRLLATESQARKFRRQRQMQCASCRSAE